MPPQVALNYALLSCTYELEQRSYPKKRGEELCHD